MVLAVKSMIVNDGKLLILKRSSDDIHKPGIWEIPGGRINPDENLVSGLKRETLEETGLDINVRRLISARHFIRDDNQEIEMHIFLCNAKDAGNVVLSEEHNSYEWVDISKAKEKLTEFFHEEIDLLFGLDDEKWP